MRHLGFLIHLMLLFLAVEVSAQTTFKVFYLGGQSNMDGYGYNKELPDSLNAPVKGVYIFHGNPAADNAAVDGRGVWTELRPGHGVGFGSDGTTNKYSDRFGVELTFARRLKALFPNDNIAIIKYSRGGSSIDMEAAAEFGCWDPDFQVGNGVNQYDHCLNAIRIALGTTDIDGDGKTDQLVPAGIVWMQGESDAAHGAQIAFRYLRNLQRLMELLRAALHADDLPVVLGRISDSGRDLRDGLVWDHGAVVRAAQAAFANSDRHAALVTSTDGYAYSDNWHYNSAGYLDLGVQFAEAMAKLMKK